MKPRRCSPSPSKVGSNIRTLRHIRGFKQTELAELVGITAVALSNIETGKADISLTRLCEIAQALKIEITLLFNDKLL